MKIHKYHDGRYTAEAARMADLFAQYMWGIHIANHSEWCC